MTPRWVRPGLALFLLLCATFASNLLFMQPSLTTYAPKRVEFGRAELGPAPDTLAAAGSSAITTASLTPADTSAVPAAGMPTLVIPGDGDKTELARAIQRELAVQGYEAGTADGVVGLVTRAAIMAYEADHGLRLTGVPTEALLKAIVMGAGPGEKASNEPASREARDVIVTVQRSLNGLGFSAGPEDGQIGQATVRAIREFEAHQGLSASGRISGQLVARLSRLAGEGRLADNR